jgi:hypothetical protein
METSERLEFCKICINRKMDIHQGLLCGLTNAKADFEGECPHLIIDEKQKTKMEMERKELLESEDYQIGGWLAIFLLVGIWANAVMAVITLICSWKGLIYAPCVLGANVALTLCILYIAIATNIAFCQRKNYAVPLAYLWVILVGLNSIFNFGLFMYGKSRVTSVLLNFLLITSIQGIVWVLIWGSFIACSERIKNIIPKPYHWRKVDIAIGGVYAVALLLTFIGITDIANHPISSKFISTNYVINTMNESRPITSNGTTELPVYKEGKIIVAPMRMENTKASDLLEHQKLGMQLFIKYIILSTAKETPYTIFFLRGNTVRIVAKDMNDADYFSFEITPEEYKDAVNMGDNYRVPKEDIDELTQAYLEILPYPISDPSSDDCQLIDIKNNQEELRYIIEITDVTYDDMTQQIGYAYLRDIIYDNYWGNIQDILIMLNEKNHKDITFAFKGIDSNKTLDVTIKYPYEIPTY